MIKKLIAFSCIAWAAAVLSSASPANARVASLQSGTHVSISPHYKAATTTICGVDYPYVQRMTVKGKKSAMVATEFIYATGRYELTLVVSCDGYYVYELTS